METGLLAQLPTAVIAMASAVDVGLDKAVWQCHVGFRGYCRGLLVVLGSKRRE